MCGIVGAVAQRDVSPILLEGLKRLEYRGYDSAGIAILDANNEINRCRTLGKVRELFSALEQKPLPGTTGIAHTRWATHGKPCEANAHPHMSGNDIAVVHNGIVENYETLREQLQAQGYEFYSETDTEIIAHLIHSHYKESQNLFSAVQQAAHLLEGAFALGVMHKAEPEHLIAVRQGSPLVVGVGIGEHFIASDHLALLPVVQKFIYLQEGNIADISRDEVKVFDREGEAVDHPVVASQISAETAERGHYRHFMQKEVFEQPEAIGATLESRLGKKDVLVETFGEHAKDIFSKVKRVQIVACGTSYHAGMVSRYWMESLVDIPCQVEIASEFRYRNPVIEEGTLFVTLSQSGETADTLAALRAAKKLGYTACLAICNVAESSLARESDLVFMTRAGVEIGVASTKAFTTQLVALLLLASALNQCASKQKQIHKDLIGTLKTIPRCIEEALELDTAIKQLAEVFAEKRHALFLGRGVQYPIAKEGALKLKEISYIHAEAYPAGELKHGPLALVDKHMPVIAVAPNDELLDKLKSNLQEVQARGGELIVFADPKAQIKSSPGVEVITMPTIESLIAPIVYTIPLQLLAYHVAVLKGTDVDQPRNLAKSVTVE